MSYSYYLRRNYARAVLFFVACFFPLAAQATPETINLDAPDTGTLSQSITASRLGSGTSMGDIDGDGYADMVIGAYEYAQKTKSNEDRFGRVYLVYGSEETFEDTDISTGAVTFTATESDNYLGYTTEILDLNGDGYDDIVMSAYGYDSDEESNIGRLYIVYGSSTRFTSQTVGDSSIYIEGDGASDFIGYSYSSLSSGDINNDGYDDLIVGVYRYDEAASNAGAVHIIYGQETELSSRLITEDTPYYTGENSSDQLGYSTAVGDFNGDGYDDILTGAIAVDTGGTNSGSAYIIYGTASQLPGGSIADHPELQGAVSSDQAGNSVAAGDLNGDGYDDIIVGVYRSDQAASNAGSTYILYGSSSEFTDGALDDGIRIDGANTGDDSGYTVQVANLNGDAYTDLLIGSIDYLSGATGGAIHLLYGQSTQFTAGDLSSYPVISAPTTSDGVAAFQPGVGDVNGDGYDDLLLGAYTATNNGSRSGEAYVVYGAASELTSASTDDLITFTGEESYRIQVNTVSITADLNGDGYDDIISGSHRGSLSGDSQGNLTILYGGSENYEDSIASKTSTIFGENRNDYLSANRALDSGDFNGDGYDDIAVGAYGYDDEGSQEGALYIIYGSSTEFEEYTITSAVKYIGVNSADSLGKTVSVGDFNGDGYDDITVGAYSYDAISDDEGALYIIYGDAAELPGGTIDSTIAITGTLTNEYIGSSIEVLDINGDSYDDIVASSRSYNVTEGGNEGRVYIVYGQEENFVNGSITSEDYIDGAIEDGSIGYNQMHAIEDINNDGYEDVLVSVYITADTEPYDFGGQYVLYGQAGTYSSSDITSYPLLTGNTEEEYLDDAYAVPFDANGDEYGDFIIGSYLDTIDYDIDGEDFYEGSVYIVLGQESNYTSGELEDIATVLMQDADYNSFGQSVSSGDYNGDGIQDLYIGQTTYGTIAYGGNNLHTLLGANPASVACTATYTDAGASAIGYWSGASRTVSADASGVDTDTPGSYSVTYTSTNVLGATTTSSRNVTVSDTTDPSIALVGDATVALTVGNTYTESGVTVSDTCDTDISASSDVTTSGSVDTDTAGTYTVTYTAEDASGNTASVTRTIAVSEVPENDVDTGEGDGTGDTSETLGSVEGITKLSNNQVTVEYTEGDSKTFTLFNGSAEAKVKLHTNNAVLIAISKKYIRTYDAYTGERIAQKKLFKNKQKYTKFKRYNVYNASDDNTANSVIVLARTKKSQKKQVKMRHIVVKNDGTMTKKNYVKVVMNQKIKKFKNVSLKRNKKNGKNFRVVLTKKGKKLSDYKFRITKKKKKLKQV